MVSLVAEKFGDELVRAVLDQGLGACAADGTAMEQRLFEVRGNGLTSFHPFGRFQKLFQCCILLFAWLKLLRRRLEIERTYAVGTRIEHEGQFVKIDVMRCIAAQTRQPIDYDPASPRIGRTVPQTPGHFKRGFRHNPAAPEGQFRRIDGYGVGPR